MFPMVERGAASCFLPEVIGSTSTWGIFFHPFLRQMGISGPDLHSTDIDTRPEGPAKAPLKWTIVNGTNPMFFFHLSPTPRCYYRMYYVAELNTRATISNRDHLVSEVAPILFFHCCDILLFSTLFPAENLSKEYFCSLQVLCLICLKPPAPFALSPSDELERCFKVSAPDKHLENFHQYPSQG
jgi:hypothetical protein